MAKVFEQVTDADGNITYQEVELSKLDVREHPEYKKVLEEQIKTRKKLAEVRQKATTEEDAPDGATHVEAQPTKPETVIPTVDDLLAEMEKRQQAKRDAETAAQAAWDTRVTAAMAKHKLPDAMRGIVENARDPEATAEALAKSSLKFANTPAGGEVDPHKEIEDTFAKVDERMGFTAKK